MANKSATRIGVLIFENGNRTTLDIGINRNTGATIVWQNTPGQREARTTGRNIARLLAELKDALLSGEVRWEDGCNTLALNAMK